MFCNCILLLSFKPPSRESGRCMDPGNIYIVTALCAWRADQVRNLPLASNRIDSEPDSGSWECGPGLPSQSGLERFLSTASCPPWL